MSGTPTPEQRPQPGSSWRLLTVPMAILLSGLAIALAVFLKPAPGQPGASTMDAKAAGLEYGKGLCNTYADSMEQAAAHIQTGQSMADVQKNMQDNWSKARTSEFNRTIVPVFSSILPEGQEPSSQAQRDQLATAFRHVSEGVRNACKSGFNWMGR